MLGSLVLLFVFLKTLLFCFAPSGVIEQRKSKPHEESYVPIPPSMLTVLEAFKHVDVPERATNEQREAVTFFHHQILAVLDTTVTSDAMHGKSIMEVLDLRTEQMKAQQDKSLKPGKSAPGWDQIPNVWAMTMATGALFLDAASGASDTTDMVHNLTVKKNKKKKKAKAFNKGKAINRCQVYSQYYAYFKKIWLAHKTGSGDKGLRKQATNMAAWDRFTGMTKEAPVSDAQKRGRELSSVCGETQQHKKRKVSCLDELGGDDDNMDYGMFLGMVGLGEEMPPLRTGGSGAAQMVDEVTDNLMELQNKEVAEIVTAL